MIKNKCHDGSVEVKISVAVSEMGIVECHVAGSNWITEERSYQKWLSEKRKSQTLWSIKTFKLRATSPTSYEDVSDEPGTETN